MIKNGDLVWSGYGGLLRVGSVKSQRLDETGWKYYTIDWYDDEEYQSAQNSFYSFNPNGNYGLDEFKSGMINKIEPERLLSILKQYKK